MSAATRTSRKPRPERRVEILSQRIDSCSIACSAVVHSGAESPTKRVALDALVRYATPPGVQRAGDYRTPGVGALDATPDARAEIHHEHVIPVRVLVDRMLAGDSPEEVLRVAMVAHVLREEHFRIGSLTGSHRRLYDEMLTAPLEDLPRMARRRYRASGLSLRRIP